MNQNVKECADKRDIKGLTYIFIDSLDVDPTFESYREDYEYCRNISGLFPGHTELTPLTDDRSKWTQEYWTNLKKDLKVNFSLKRFEHMKKVARQLFADKAERINSGRQAANVNTTIPQPVSSGGTDTSEQRRQQQIAAAMAQREETIKREKEEAQRREAQRKEEQRRKAQEAEEKARAAEAAKREAGTPAKKADRAWITAAVIAVIIILVIILL